MSAEVSPEVSAELGRKEADGTDSISLVQKIKLKTQPCCNRLVRNQYLSPNATQCLYRQGGANFFRTLEEAVKDYLPHGFGWFSVQPENGDHLTQAGRMPALLRADDPT